MSEHNEIINSEREEPRGLPSVGKGKGGKAGEKMAFAAVAVIAIAAIVGVNGGFSGNKDEQNETKNKPKQESIVSILGDAPDLPEPPKAPVEEKEEIESPNIIHTDNVPPPPPAAPVRGSNGKRKLTPEERKMTASVIKFNDTRGGGNRQQQLTPEEQAAQIAQAQANRTMFMGSDGDEGDKPLRNDMADNLKTTELEGVKASLMVDRDYFITTGTFLDCALETAISSDLSGMTSCRLTNDVYSTSGRVKLLERGSRITGQYKGGIKRGTARIFVVWNRVETPNGVMVNLESPGTGALGRSGHDGFVDTHFWDRFGGAMMLSLVDDLGAYLGQKLTDNSGVPLNNSSEAAQNAAAIALENSINIPPTLIKNQGDHINVFIARDMDFRGVYKLETR